MEEFPPAALARQRRMKRVARAFFALSALAALTPIVVGLFGYNTDLPITLITAALMITGIVIQTRSDPAYARTSQNHT
ncbi:hypothetical protein [Corynebacterium dentalis]|uniref:hypothetical protein n=1 Tax=Corynebacterium dentalis TaxID=2014528 RepID=UPI00289B285D|nr:hypothetical protein [Corynebacterium dentalis]